MLTPAQLTTLKAAILAETDANFVDYRQQGAVGAMADFYNQPGAFVVWKTSVPTGDLFDAIIWANLTPNPAPDGTAAWTNRSLACQGKQFNLQTMLTGRESINPSKTRIRSGFQDALTDIPSGNNGAARQGGWDQVVALMYRFATRGEALYATGTGTMLAPGLLVIEAGISIDDVIQAINLP